MLASQGTHERLLEAGGEVFAECGYHEATVRAICQRAKANIASVSYHFGDKAQFYREVLRFGAGKVLARFPVDRDLPAAKPEEELRAFVQAMISRFLDPAGPDWYGRVCMRELVEPTAALDSLVKDVVRPLTQRLERVVRALAGRRTSDDSVGLCVRSILGQCLFYHHSRAVIERVYGKDLYASANIEQVSRHITAFSLAALRQLAQGKAKESRNGKHARVA